jgi:MFS family permease
LNPLSHYIVKKLGLRKLYRRFELLRNRNFRLHWISSLVSMLGDFFLFVAMPFLVMNLTEDRSAIGGILAVGGIPRALFLLFGGAFSDRFSPLLMMKVSRVVFCLLLAGMSVLILLEQVNLLGLYIFSGAMGIVGAFGMPAGMAILPQLVKHQDLASANALTGGASQLISALAPAIVGVAVLYLSTEPMQAIMNGVWPAITELPKRADMQGIGLAYSVDVILIIVSMWPLWAIQVESEVTTNPVPEGIMKSIKEGFAYVWADTSLRAFIVYMAITTFVSMGPQMVGMPVLADDRLDGMRSYGIMMSASGLGAVAGSLLAAVLAPANRTLGTIMMLLAVVRGICTFLISRVETTTQGILIMTLLGVLMGYSSILFMTWIQKRVQLSFLGRVMSLVMLSVMGLQPLSQGFSGWYIDVAGLTSLFVGIGVFMTVTPLVALMSRDIRRMGEPQDNMRPV